MRKLYKPEKYPVFIGKGSDGLCTTWSNPEALLKKYPLLERFAIIGTLYSEEGVSVIIRNLALNPDIRRLYLLNDSPLSRTEYGKRGWSLLKKVWEKGDGSIHPEIDRGILRRMIENVELIEIGMEDLEGLVKEEAKKEEAYMEPVEFPERKQEDVKPLPSEGAGFIARGNIWQAWLRAIDKVMRYGQIKGSDYGMRQKELEAVLWVIEKPEIEVPDWDEEVLKSVGFRGYEKYLGTYLDPEKPEDVAYTYGQRLRNFKGIDQVEEIIQKLKKSKDTRRAVASLFDPLEDFKHSSPPCLVFVQFLRRGEELDMFAVFRSHDMFKAAIPNAIGLMNLHKFVSQGAGMKQGELAILSISAHIYEQDWAKAKDLLMCQIWGRKKDKFEMEDADPRGNVLIRVEKDEIVAEINGIEVRGRTAMEVGYTLANLDLLSKPQHWIDIGMELMKAEISKELGLKYVQDRKLSPR